MNERTEQWFGAYQAFEVIARGETAIVYRGHQPSLGRTVAIKVLLHSHNPAFAARFRREARALAQLEHHNILPIYDYGEQDGLLYIVTQHVDHNLALQDILGDPMESLAALRLIGSILEGLDYAHRHGVIHRNIKPASILLPLPEWPVLADFGIARFDDEDQTMTMPGISLESAQYMAPEFIENQPTDVRTDLYSLGAVLYHMLAGRPPFAAATPLAVLQHHATAPLPDPRLYNPALPESAVHLLGQALAKAPGERFANAEAMLEAARNVVSQIELSSSDHHVQQVYQTGVLAFAEGDWNQALRQLGQVQHLSTHHTSIVRLMTIAQQEQRRAQLHAQNELARLQRQATLTSAERAALGSVSHSALNMPELAGPDEPIASERTTRVFKNLPFVRQTPLRILFYTAAIIATLALLVLVVVLVNNGFRF